MKSPAKLGVRVPHDRSGRAACPHAAAPWPKVKLGEIAIMKRGKYITRGSTRPGNIPVILGGQEPAYYCDEANHNGPCIVISRSGASAGFVSFWNEPIFVTDGFLFETTAVCDIRYLYSCLKFNQHLLGHLQNGTGIPHVRGEDLKLFPIPLPPLPIQKRIASVLGTYDDLIENNRRRIALLEKMARELYREQFVRRDVKGNTVTLGEIGIRLETGTRPKGGIKDISEGVPSVGAENVIGLGQYNFASEKLVSEEFFKAMKRGIVNDRDILLYKDGAYIGRVSLFQDGFPHKRAAVNEHVFLLHANDEALQYFLFFTLAQEKYFKIMQGLNENAAQPGLNQRAVLGLKVLLPPKEDILVFDSHVAPMVAEIFNLALQNRSLSRQRDRLLPRLMSGKIDVEALVKEEK